MDIDAKVIRGDALAMKRIDAADPAEEVPRGHRVKLVFGKRILAREQFEVVLVHLHHQRVLAAADGAVASGQLGKVRFDLKADRAAMATTLVLFHVVVQALGRKYWIRALTLIEEKGRSA